MLTCKQISSPYTIQRTVPIRIDWGLRSVALTPLGPGQALLLSLHRNAHQVEDCQAPEIILVLYLQNLYPALRFYLVLRAGSLCEPSLEMSVSLIITW